MNLSPSLALAALLALAGPAPAVAAPGAVTRVPLDRVAATVNGEVVTYVELVRRAGSSYEQAQQLPPGKARDEAVAEALRKAFDLVVADRLFQAQAKELDIEITDAQVDAQIEDIKKRNNFDDAAFQAALRQEGLDLQAFRAQIRAQLQNYSLLQAKIGNKVKTTDEDLRNYYQSHPQEFEGAEEVHVRHIFLPIPAGASDAQVAKVQAEAQRVVQRLKAGADFAQIAKAVSKGPAADDGGDLGWIRRGTLDHALEDPAFALKAGQISDPIRFGPGFHVLRVDERRRGGGKTFEEAREEIRARLVEEQGETYRKQYIAELRRDALIDVKLPELKP
ncbi:peptidylprolyl isomerase [Anaeromyxobacter oryzisoli]|uniref:peptidylprolyl isomerase n=1 Tax=Anaeromyxobacter oryzisoli TaxID=2925408 RepID=UPI001F59F6C6|nr:peptidylprolyl isomerase [Anaeromyxobacter sp. SG63]